MTVMRWCVWTILEFILVAGCVFAQSADSASTLTPLTPSNPATSDQASAASPSIPDPTLTRPSAALAGPLQPVVLTSDASGTVPTEQIRELLRRAEQKDLENERQLRQYTYIERQVEHKLDGQGNVTKTEVRTSEVLMIYGEQVEKLVAKNDKPLSADEAKKEDEKIQKIIDKRKSESEDERRKRLEKEEKTREDERKFVLEIADAFNFRLVGSETVEGRDAWVLEGEPRPGYQPKHKDAKMLSKFHGRVWIDKGENQWVKMDISALDTIAIGLFLARIHKGARVVVDLTKVNEEVWLPKHVEFRLDARVALLKNYREDVEQTFGDYKKFRTESKVTVLGEETH